MLESDRKDFAALVARVYDFYGKRSEFSEFALHVWWTGLQQYDFAAIRDAVGRHSLNPDNGQWLPRPADVVRLLEGSFLDTAQQAWVKVQAAIGSAGTYQTVCFDDPIINAVLAEMGGWIALGKVELDELPFRQKEFEQRYRAWRTRGGVKVWPRCLHGIFARDNAAFHGKHDDDAVVLIGDATRARAVFEGGGDRTSITTTKLLTA